MPTEVRDAPEASRNGDSRKGSLRSGRGRIVDPIFKWVVAACGTTVLIILALMIIRTTSEAWPVFVEEGFFGFLLGDTWDPGDSHTEISGTYGAWPFIYITLINSAIAIVLALPPATRVAVHHPSLDQRPHTHL